MDGELLDGVVIDHGDQSIDRAEVRDRFVDVGREYADEVSDPTVGMMETLVDHFEDRDPEDISDETAGTLWTLCNVLRWMLDDLPVNGEATDPEWLRQQLELWGGVKGTDGR
ncbi:hypothetical protein GJ629_07580 [Halapricum sp. CBA1109]|uniref:hypothetical protein n=1 Tax=Halapricum sp. CBA1109 TaxID=2668068 RepID=UPI0012FBCE27|nr:hypothetical protein [Halapricum sp. CBA1109]MUV89773.1 hypothetical protein [Halapricum sp. CBA1109]